MAEKVHNSNVTTSSFFPAMLSYESLSQEIGGYNFFNFKFIGSFSTRLAVGVD